MNASYQDRRSGAVSPMSYSLRLRTMPPSRSTRRRLGKVLAAESGLRVLLISLFLVQFVIFPFVPLAGPGRILVTAGLSAILISGSFSLGGRPLVRVIAAGLATVALALLWLHHLVPRDAVLFSAYAASIGFLGLTTAGVLARVLRAERVTSRQIEGAVAAYLMIGLLWGFAYTLLELSYPGSFNFSTEAAGADPVESRRELAYFSFVTLTTLGYGDVTPRSPSARTLATLEALVGQLYLVILIARLVSLRANGEEAGSPSA